MCFLIIIYITSIIFSNSVIHENGIKVINGKIIDIEKVPWCVSIHKRCAFIFETQCQGIIINKQFILTAGHCIDTSWYCKHNIYAGSNRNDIGLDLNVKDVFVHPQYDEKSQRNDIAIIKLGTKLNFTKNIKEIQLMDETYTYDENLDVQFNGFDYKDGLLKQIQLRTHHPICRSNSVNDYDCKDIIAAIDLNETQTGKYVILLSCISLFLF